MTDTTLSVHVNKKSSGSRIQGQNFHYVWKWKSKDPEREQMYKVISGQLTWEEWMQQAENSGKKKKRWIHPLHQKAYRKKFGLAAR